MNDDEAFEAWWTGADPLMGKVRDVHADKEFSRKVFAAGRQSMLGEAKPLVIAYDHAMRPLGSWTSLHRERRANMIEAMRAAIRSLGGG